MSIARVSGPTIGDQLERPGRTIRARRVDARPRRQPEHSPLVCPTPVHAACSAVRSQGAGRVCPAVVGSGGTAAARARRTLRASKEVGGGGGANATPERSTAMADGRKGGACGINGHCVVLGWGASQVATLRWVLMYDSIVGAMIAGRWMLGSRLGGFHGTC